MIPLTQSIQLIIPDLQHFQGSLQGLKILYWNLGDEKSSLTSSASISLLQRKLLNSIWRQFHIIILSNCSPVLNQFWMHSILYQRIDDSPEQQPPKLSQLEIYVREDIKGIVSWTNIWWDKSKCLSVTLDGDRFEIFGVQLPFRFEKDRITNFQNLISKVFQQTNKKPIQKQVLIVGGFNFQAKKLIPNKITKTLMFDSFGKTYLKDSKSTSDCAEQADYAITTSNLKIVRKGKFEEKTLSSHLPIMLELDFKLSRSQVAMMKKQYLMERITKIINRLLSEGQDTQKRSRSMNVMRPGKTQRLHPLVLIKYMTKKNLVGNQMQKMNK